MTKTGLLASLALVGLAGPALAQNPGDIVFTDFTNDRIGLISGGTVSTLVDLSGGSTRLGGIARGPDGAYYFGDGPYFISNPSTARIIRVGDLFGVPQVSTFVSSDPIQNPGGMVYDQQSSRFLAVNNPFGPIAQTSRDGILGIPANGVGVHMAFNEPPLGNPRPRYEAGFYMTRDQHSNDYFVTALNGGAFAGTGGDDDGSTLWRASVVPGSPELMMTLVYDFSNAPFAVPLTQVRGVTSVPGTNDLYLTDWERGAIYRMTLDNAGQFQSLALVRGGLLNPEAIVYNAFTNRLIVDQSDEMGGFLNAAIFEVSLDGTQQVQLASGFHARDFYVVPTPGTLALLGVGGLVALRRRR